MAGGRERALVVGLGEVLWDCFPGARRPGGAPANVAFHVNQLGLEGVLCSRVGTDEDGRTLLAALQSRGLATRCVQTDPDRPTGRVLVDERDPQAPVFRIEEDAAWDRLAFDASWSEVLPRAQAVCFGTLAQRSPASRAAIHAALDAAPQATCVYDVNLRPPFVECAWVEASLCAAHTVKLNREETVTLAGLLDLPDATPPVFARAVCDRYGVDTVCITRGAEGCYVLASDGETDVEGVQVEVVDAVGAGDAFTAGWIAARLWGWPVRRSALFANALGALVASRPGAMPLLFDEIGGLRDRLGR